MLVCLGVTLCAGFFVTGCTKTDRSGNTIDEPEITVEYLTGEYAQQLLRDGAEYIFGTITINTLEDGTIECGIDGKEFVEDQDQESGYYIADRNLDYTYPLPAEARTTFMQGGTSIAQVMTTDEFVAAVQKDFEEYGKSNPDYQKSKLYDIYVMNDQIELVTARYLP